MKHKLAVFVSGNGSNAEEIMKHFQGHPQVEVKVLITNNPKAYAIERAKKFAVLHEVVTKQDFESPDFAQHLRDHWGITHIALAGFLWLIPGSLIETFPNRIINIHPALLPKYGGKGMYGMKVHEAVCANRELTSGITIHLVNDKYDEGEIISQQTIEVSPDDKPEDVAKKVQSLEHYHYPRVIERWITQ